MKHLFLFLTSIVSINGFTQSKVDSTYYEIADYGDHYTAGSVLARSIDGLGFRFFWATEGLRSNDLNYRPNAEVRSVYETIQHINSLSKIILNAAKQQSNEKTDTALKLNFSQLRLETLTNLKEASEIFIKSDDLKVHQLKFGNSTIPLWNLINGPIEDAVWHCGQISSFRRTSGNPINPNINFFSGKVRN